METWLKEHFPLLPNGEVMIYKTARGYYGYDPTRAAMDFGNLGASPAHSVLSALPLAAQGWQRIFDDWKERGLVS